MESRPLRLALAVAWGVATFLVSANASALSLFPALQWDIYTDSPFSIVFEHGFGGARRFETATDQPGVLTQWGDGSATISADIYSRSRRRGWHLELRLDGLMSPGLADSSADTLLQLMTSPAPWDALLYQSISGTFTGLREQEGTLLSLNARNAPSAFPIGLKANGGSLILGSFGSFGVQCSGVSCQVPNPVSATYSVALGNPRVIDEAQDVSEPKSVPEPGSLALLFAAAAALLATEGSRSHGPASTARGPA